MSETKWSERFEKLLGDETFQSDLAQINAKALLGETLTESPINWTYLASSRIVRNLTAASMAFDAISTNEPENLGGLSKSIRRIASAWEGLARLGDKVNKNTAYMNAAVTYEIAGYQANASCLAKLVSSRRQGEDGSPRIEEVISQFLQRLFIKTRILSFELEKEPADTIELVPEKIGQAAAAALAANGLERASRFFLSGRENALQEAADFLKESQELYAGLGLHREYNLVRSAGTLLPLMVSRSTWTKLKEVLPGNRLWERYLRLLARGIGSDILVSRSVSELWPSQVVALNGGLLGDASKFVRMPTSAGKTRIAELAIVHTLISKRDKGAKCIYIAPYRALVWELEQSFLNLFGDLGFRVSSFIGNYESDEFQEILAEDADILVLTPEKLDLLQRASPQFLEKVELFIMDEGQIMDEESRGVKFELLLTRLKMQLKSARFLFLSAVVPQQTLEDFANWLKADITKDLAVTDWRPSQQRHAMFRWSGDRGWLYYATDPDLAIPKEFVPGILTVKNYRFVNPKTGRINHERFPTNTNKAQTAAELAFTFSDLGPVLVFCAQTPSVGAVAKALQHRLDLTRWTRGETPDRFRPRELRSMLLADEWLGRDHLVSRLLRRGIALHYSTLPDYVRKAIETDFRNREYQVIVATSTLAQGVNLPIKTVIMHSCRRWLSEERPSVPITAREYWNIAGRAGRAGEETEGTIIQMVENVTDQLDFRRYVAMKSKIEPVHSALLQMAQGLIDTRISPDEARSMIDPEVLALLVEESSDATTESTISDVLERSLLRVQSQTDSISTEKIRTTLLTSANDIRARVPDRELLRTYSATGLSTNSCELLKGYVENNRSAVETLLKYSGNPEELVSIIDSILEACNPLVEIRTEPPFPGNVRDLLLAWMEGTSVANLYSRFATESGSPEDLARFIGDSFSYKLPWGVSAFLRVSTKVLGMTEDDVSVPAKFLPSLVKFGVPTPLASWALSSGVPSRSAAIRLAEGYLLEKEITDSKEFLKWFNDLDYETLVREYHFSGQLLGDISRAVNRCGINSLLKFYEGPERFYPTETWVRGIRYDNRRLVALKAKEGDLVILRRDYDNVSDRNAIEVQLNGEPLGFLAGNLAQVMAVDLDSGFQVNGTITKIERHQVPEVKLQLTLE